MEGLNVNRKDTKKILDVISSVIRDTFHWVQPLRLVFSNKISMISIGMSMHQILYVWNQFLYL